MVPIWKVIVDSFDKTAGYGMNFWPQQFTFGGYGEVISKSALYRPFLISCIVTVAGTFLGLLLATLGAYVLIQWEMPGRNLFAYMLLFTMIFDGGMIPKYLVMKELHLLDTLFSVILPLAINVYNLVLMRNFFEGIPEALFEAAEIDGAAKWDILWKIRVPMVMSSITICVFLTLTNSFKLFDQNLALTGGDPNHATEMLALNIYQTFYARAGMQWKGYGQAKAVIFCVLVIIISLVQLKATRSKEVQQ